MEPITRIDVMGKSADEVVEEVLGKLGKPSAGKAGKVCSVTRMCRKHGYCVHTLVLRLHACVGVVAADCVPRTVRHWQRHHHSKAAGARVFLRCDAASRERNLCLYSQLA